MADLGQSLGWDDEVSVVSSEYVLLDPGEYDFRVVSFERDMFDGSEKMSACPVAVIGLSIIDPKTGATASATSRLFCNTKVAWRITQFFKCVGLIDPDTADGSRVRLSLFDQCVGRTGRVKIKHREYSGTKYNDIDRFIVPKAGAAQAPAQGKSWGGSF